MKRKLTVLSAISILGLSTAAMADTPYVTAKLKPTAVPAYQPIAISSIDIDGDGMLSQTEMRAVMKLMRTHRKAVRKAKRANKVARFDANGDGKLSKAERRAGKKARFAKLDTNGDGMISSAEASGKRIGKRFAKLDTDGNGLLTKAELAKAKRKHKGRKMRKGRKGKHGKAGRLNRRNKTNKARKGKRNNGRFAQ